MIAADTAVGLAGGLWSEKTDPRLTQAQTIARLNALPDSALFTPAEASIYLNVRRDLLRAWRWRGVGPAHVGRGHLTRYRKSALDRFLEGGMEQPAA